MFFQSEIKKGFTLIEALFAVFIISVGLIAIASVISNVLKLSSYSASKLTAAYLAQEGIEIVRNIRDTNWLEARNYANSWDEGLTNCLAGCAADYTTPSVIDPNLNTVLPDTFLNVETNGFYRYSIGNPTKFKRKITIQKPSASEMDVVVQVTWSGSGCPSLSCNFSTQENLYDWRW